MVQIVIPFHVICWPNERAYDTVGWLARSVFHRVAIVLYGHLLNPANQTEYSVYTVQSSNCIHADSVYVTHTNYLGQRYFMAVT